MPLVEEYGAQPPIELLRQLSDQGGWYDLATMEWRSIIDTQLVGAMGPPGGGRSARSAGDRGGASPSSASACALSYSRQIARSGKAISRPRTALTTQRSASASSAT